MKVLSQTLYKGANIYSNQSVVMMTVRLGARHDIRTLDAGPEFVDRILSYLPGLEKRAYLGERVGECALKMKQHGGMHLAELIWRLSIELQKKMEMPVRYGNAEPTQTPSVFNVVYEYSDPVYGEKAGQLAIALIQKCLPATLSDTDSPAIHFDFDAIRNPLSQWSANRRMDINTRYIIEAAVNRNIPYLRIDSKIAQLGYGVHRKMVRSATTELLSLIGFKMTEDKEMTANTLRRLGMPVPRQVSASNVQAALRGARQIGFPVVVKPRDSYTGLGVSTALTTLEEVEAAYHEAVKYSSRAIIETHIPGEDHRLLVIGDELVAAVKRLPAQIVSDGKQTIRELVERMNRNRHAYGRRPKYDIKVDAVSEIHLQRQGYTFDSVAPEGVTVYFRSASNYSQGGTCIDITDDVHPDNRDLAIRAAAAFDMDICGVDFITPDISKSYKEGCGAICEVGSRPGLLLHVEPDVGEPRDVANPIVDLLYEPGSDGRIPIIAVSGNRQKQLAARMAAQIITYAGRDVGLATKPEIFVAGVSIGLADTKPHRAAEILLNDDSIEAAVIETNINHFHAFGLGYDACSICAVTNIEWGSDEASKERTVTSYTALFNASKGPVIVNADDEPSMELLRLNGHRETFLVSCAADSPMIRSQIEQNKPALFVSPEALIYHDGKAEHQVLRENTLPAELQGTTLFAALFAAASAIGIGIPFEQVANSLMILTTKNPLPIKWRRDFGCEIVAVDSIRTDAIDRILATLETLQTDGRTLLVCDADFMSRINGKLHARRSEALFDEAFVVGNCDCRVLGSIPLTTAASDAFALQKALLRSAPTDRIAVFTSRFVHIGKLLDDSRIKGALFEAARSESPATSREPLVSPYSSKKDERLWYADELALAVNGEWVNHPGSHWYGSGVTYFDWAIKPGDIVIASNKEQWPKKYDDLQSRIPQLFERGASAAIVSNIPPNLNVGEKYPVLVVKNTRAALDHLGSAAILRSKAKTVAVTGSVGKSTTTTMIDYLLQQQGKTHATVKNFNSTPGVPLTAARTPRDCEYAVYEIGIGRSHRANYLRAKMINPDVAMITTIQPDHIEFYKSIDGIINAKTDILKEVKSGGTAILNRDSPYFELQRTTLESKFTGRVLTFGEHPESDIRLMNVLVDDSACKADVVIDGRMLDVIVPHPGRHMLQNATAALAAVYALGADWEKAARDLRDVPKMAGRADIQTRPCKDGTYTLIDDAYSANPGSVVSALELLGMLQPNRGGRRVAVLGEMKELGDATRQLHLELREPILKTKLDKVYMLGKGIKPLWETLPDEIRGLYAESSEAVVADLQHEIRDGDILLVKGSARSLVAMNEILQYLKRGQEPPTVALPKKSQPLYNAPRVIPLKRASDARLLFLGDTGFGENYQERIEARGGQNILKSRGYDYPLEKIKPMLLEADAVIANLETPLTSIKHSPFEGQKSWIHHGHPDSSSKALLRHNIGFAMLANNHSFDYGEEGFFETLNTLEEADIGYAGAGRTESDAHRALRLRFGFSKERVTVAVISVYQWSRQADEKFGMFAKNGSRGLNAMLLPQVRKQIENLRKEEPECFIIVSPHWGRNYQWRSSYQREVAEEVLAAGADLIIGHGSHMVQEFERIGAKWVVYSVGNFMFNSPGRYKKFNAPPFSLIASLSFVETDVGIRKSLRLYPIVTDNNLTHYQIRRCDEVEFESLSNTLEEQGCTLLKSSDIWGHFFELRMNE